MALETLKSLVECFAGKRVLVIGDLMLDEYLWGEVNRISPEAPVPIVEVRRRTYSPGGASNVACNVVSLGGHATLGGVVGKDSHAALLCDGLMMRGVEPGGVVEVNGRPTTCKTRVIAHNQQVVRADSECRDALDPASEQRLLEWAARAVRGADVCLLSDYGKGVLTPGVTRGLISLAREQGKPVLVDPKGNDYRKYLGASVITPNVQETEGALNRRAGSEDELLGMGRELQEMLQGSAVLITRGANGMTLLEEGVDAVTIPAVTRQVFDVTGAGDTVISTLALSLAAGAELCTAARLANYAAGIAVSKVGTAATSREELDKLLSDELGVGGDALPAAASAIARSGLPGTPA